MSADTVALYNTYLSAVPFVLLALVFVGILVREMRLR